MVIEVVDEVKFEGVFEEPDLPILSSLFRFLLVNRARLVSAGPSITEDANFLLEDRVVESRWVGGGLLLDRSRKCQPFTAEGQHN